MKNRNKDLGKTWDQDLIEREKRSIKASLDIVDITEDPASKWRVIRSALAELGEEDSSVGRLRRFIYAISALIHHERFGCLTPRDIADLTDLAHTILKVQGIKPRESRLAGLYGDIHLIKSQIQRKEGNHWQAAWEQEFAWHLAGAQGSGGAGFQYLCMGNRALRLGQGPHALHRYYQALDETLTQEHRERTYLGLVQAYSLMGEVDKAKSVSSEVRAEIKNEWIVQELGWFDLISHAKSSGDWSMVLKATSKNGSHFLATYVVEAALWPLVIQTKAYMDRAPQLQSLRRNKNLLIPKIGTWYEVGVDLQACYDTEIPLSLRLRKVSAIVESRHGLANVEQELLVLCAVARWLVRSKSHDLGYLVLEEYRSLSLKLSAGHTSDALGVMADLISDEDALLKTFFSTHHSPFQAEQKKDPGVA